jgi:hypothetical protein
MRSLTPLGSAPRVPGDILERCGHGHQARTNETPQAEDPGTTSRFQSVDAWKIVHS